MKNDQHVIDQINEYLSAAFEVETVHMLPLANMRQVLELDSLDYIDLVVVVENNFGFRVKPEDFMSIISFQDFYSYILSRMQINAPTDAILAGQITG